MNTLSPEQSHRIDAYWRAARIQLIDTAFT